MLLIWVLRLKQENFITKFSNEISPLFPGQMLSIRTSFREKIAHLKSAKEMASFLIVENASHAPTCPDVCTTYIMYMIVPVIFATAERSFSKLKLIKKLSSKLYVPRKTLRFGSAIARK